MARINTSVEFYKNQRMGSQTHDWYPSQNRDTLHGNMGKCYGCKVPLRPMTRLDANGVSAGYSIPTFVPEYQGSP